MMDEDSSKLMLIKMMSSAFSDKHEVVELLHKVDAPFDFTFRSNGNLLTLDFDDLRIEFELEVEDESATGTLSTPKNGTQHFWYLSQLLALLKQNDLHIMKVESIISGATFNMLESSNFPTDVLREFVDIEGLNSPHEFRINDFDFVSGDIKSIELVYSTDHAEERVALCFSFYYNHKKIGVCLKSMSNKNEKQLCDIHHMLPYYVNIQNHIKVHYADFYNVVFNTTT